MLRNYLTMIVRNFRRQKLFTLINIAGLAIGITGSMLIWIYVVHEGSYDTFHHNAERIYRVTQKANFPNGYNHHFARCSETWINNLIDEFPEIEAMIRFQHSEITDIRIDDRIFRDRHTFATDANVFDVFDFKLIRGNPLTALKEPNSVVLTTEMAAKYFNAEDPLGKTIEFMNEGAEQYTTYTVTGVMEPLAHNAHFSINFLNSFRNAEERSGWAYIYLLLKEGTDADILSSKFPPFIEKFGREGLSQYLFLVLQKITDIHLHSNLARELEINGNIFYLYLFTLVAIFLILIAAINFMNLATARSLERAREVGIRKVLGSQRSQLAAYFYSEAILFTMIAFFIALILVTLSLPLFSQLTGKTMTVFDTKILTGFVLISLITGLLAGSYPAIVLSRFEPVTVLKGEAALSSSPAQLTLRKGLVVVQLIISIGLIIGTLVTWQQFNYLSNKNLGLNTEQIVAIRNIPREVKSKYYTLKNKLAGIPGIIAVSASMEEPSREIRDTGFIFAEGIQEGDNAPVIDLQCVDENYIQFMQIELLAGRTFSPTLAANYQFPRFNNMAEMAAQINSRLRVYILNEAALDIIGWTSPDQALNKQFSWSNSLLTLQRGPVIGVVKNFHQESLRNRIDPLVLIYEPFFVQTILIRIRPHNVVTTLSQIETRWKQLYPQQAFEFVFVDELFANLYMSEKKQTQILMIFTCIIIFIAFLGIFGLAAYTAERRRKELGIRKILGATLPAVVFLLTREFITYVLIAGLIAAPLAWYWLQDWLQSFAHRIDINWPVFVLALVIALITVILTVSFQAMKAALINPAESLRHE